MRRVIVSNSLDPAYNLAAEEYLVSTAGAESEILYLWQNQRTVVIGRNQNPWKECAVEALQQAGGTLIRRRSGGGAVYHDLGNLNFTFISAASKERIAENSEIIVNALASFGIEARFTGKNDILVDERKVSGCAYYEDNGILCHHGTLLVSTVMDDLEAMLKPSMLKLQSKGIDSIRSRVVNLSELNPAVTVQTLTDVLCRLYSGSNQREDVQVSCPESLSGVECRKAVYQSWEWCFGESPEFSTQKSFRLPWGEVDVNMEVRDGVISRVKVYSDALDVELPMRLEALLLGERFDSKGLDYAVLLSKGKKKAHF